VKLVGLLTVRNEQWVLGLTVRAALSAMDELIVVDHASDDATPEILAQVAAEHPGRVHLLREEDSSWREAAIRQRLLDEARGRGATHVCALDADEVIAGTLLPGLRDELAALAPGEGLRVPWIDLWRNLDEFRDDSSPFSRSRGILGFRDHPGVGYRPSDQGIDIHVRKPKGLLGQRCFPASREEGGVLHLAYVHGSRIWTRTVWYKMIELLRFRDHRTPEQLNEMYHSSYLDETDLRTSPVPPAWWAPYAALRNQVDLSAASWFEQECRRLWNEHGARAFQGLDLWGVVGKV